MLRARTRSATTSMIRALESMPGLRRGRRDVVHHRVDLRRHERREDLLHREHPAGILRGHRGDHAGPVHPERRESLQIRLDPALPPRNPTRRSSGPWQWSSAPLLPPDRQFRHSHRLTDALSRGPHILSADNRRYDRGAVGARLEDGPDVVGIDTANADNGQAGSPDESRRDPAGPIAAPASGLLAV